MSPSSIRIFVCVAGLFVTACTYAVLDQGKNQQRPARKPIAVVFDGGEVKVDPYFASAHRGQKVEWYSNDGTVRIELLAPKKKNWWDNPRPLTNLGCDKKAGCPGYCSIQIARDHPYGRYPYYAYLTTPDGTEHKVNQPEIIIRD